MQIFLVIINLNIVKYIMPCWGLMLGECSMILLKKIYMEQRKMLI
ncbi:hypothetical protein SA3033_04315 [Aggregatibacter actinomycetemcomitans serotype d str. SA3033]|nr:hypothetical protein HMPREF9996_02163 [Aggregatibacter actinomycetemcomitans Y4]KYK84071.1 hypothetical protein SA3033_04315 [Aggregatibacter actinomycetemcomitans serotype d str. SA3033]KYK86062.1 hypothetical protein SA2200_08045 [Aggregatibacter actinomycetemcomitans serotype d str. SA2200]